MIGDWKVWNFIVKISGENAIFTKLHHRSWLNHTQSKGWLYLSCSQSIPIRTLWFRQSGQQLKRIFFFYFIFFCSIAFQHQHTTSLIRPPSPHRLSNWKKTRTVTMPHQLSNISLVFQLPGCWQFLSHPWLQPSSCNLISAQRPRAGLQSGFRWPCPRQSDCHNCHLQSNVQTQLFQQWAGTQKISMTTHSHNGDRDSGKSTGGADIHSLMCWCGDFPCSYEM